MDFFLTLYIHLETTRQFGASILSTPLGVRMHCNLYLFLVVTSLEYKVTTHSNTMQRRVHQNKYFRETMFSVYLLVSKTNILTKPWFQCIYWFTKTNILRSFQSIFWFTKTNLFWRTICFGELSSITCHVSQYISFSCPEQLQKYSCRSVGPSVSRSVRVCL